MDISSGLSSKLKGIIKNFKKTKILVLGDIILDRFIWGEVNRISPEAPVPVVVVRNEEVRLGGAGNVAANIKSLGGEPILMGVIGNDMAGEAVEEELARLRLSNTAVLLDMGRPTIVKTRIIAAHQQVCRVDREANMPMSMDLFKKAVHFFNSAISNVDGILVSDYGKGLINQRLLSTLLPIAHGKNKITAIDPKFQDYTIYRPTTILTPNQKEAEFASGILIKDEKDLQEAAGIILQKTNTENLLITRGEAGMSLFRPTGYSRHIPTFAREVFDVTGAGDTVIATLTLALCSGANPEEAAVLANHAAGLVVAKLGTAVVEPEELIDALNS